MSDRADPVELRTRAREAVAPILSYDTAEWDDWTQAIADAVLGVVIEAINERVESLADVSDHLHAEGMSDSGSLAAVAASVLGKFAEELAPPEEGPQ